MLVLDGDPPTSIDVNPPWHRTTFWRSPRTWRRPTLTAAPWRRVSVVSRPWPSRPPVWRSAARVQWRRHAKPAARDQALRSRAATRVGVPSAVDRAAGARDRIQADAHLRPGRLRQDDAPGRVAGGRSGRWTAGGVALARPRRQSARVLLGLPDHRAADGGTGVGRGCALPPAGAPATADRDDPRDAAQRARRGAGRRRAGARRLPRRRRARRPRRDGVPPRAPAPAAAPGDHHPRRPRPAAGPPAGARRAGRDPRRRPALHAGRGRRLPQRVDGAGPRRAATSPRWRGAPRAGSPPSSWRRSRSRGATTSPASSRASPGTTATSSTTWSRRSCTVSPSASGASCCGPRSWTG